VRGQIGETLKDIAFLVRYGGRWQRTTIIAFFQ